MIFRNKVIKSIKHVTIINHADYLCGDLMKRLTIGIFIDVFYPMVDGVVKVTDHQARMLSKNHDVYVFAPKSKDAHYVDDFPIK